MTMMTMTARSEVDDAYHYIDDAAMAAQQSRFEVELEIKRGERHLLRYIHIVTYIV